MRGGERVTIWSQVSCLLYGSGAGEDRVSVGVSLTRRISLVVRRCSGALRMRPNTNALPASVCTQGRPKGDDTHAHIHF